MKIITVFNELHSLIKNNQTLTQKIKEFVENFKHQEGDKYVCTGLQVQDVFLGIDFNKKHIMKFPKILHNVLAIDNFSRYQADMSRVLLKLIINGEHIANLTEDVSENGKYQIYDQGIYWGPYNDYLKDFFNGDVERAVFVVHNETKVLRETDRIKKPVAIPVRLPIVDVDHIELNPPFNDLYNADNRHAEELYKLIL